MTTSQKLTAESFVMKPNRPNDFIYDPNYILSGAKDFYKQSMIGRFATAQYQVCPIFQTMFSDLRNYPRKQYVIRRTENVPEYVDKIHEPSSNLMSQVLGPDRHKYFHSPVQPEGGKAVPKLDMSCFYSLDDEKRWKEGQAKIKRCCKNVSIQTKYRESSAQTSPWEPDYTVIQGDPELLKVDFLKWGEGLPAGEHEVALIERARMKKSWEKAMPPAHNKEDFSKRKNILAAMERDQWMFREKEIQDIQDLRMELLEKMLEELHTKSKCRVEKKMRLFTDLKIKEKKEKIRKLRKDSTREKRRLEFHYKGILSKYGAVNVFDEHADYKSELYIPLIRHGLNPKYGSEIISNSSKKYKSQYYKVEIYDTLPPLDHVTDIKEVKIPGTRLCIRETKWTSAVLQKLHTELKNLRSETRKCVNLRVRIEHTETELPTPEIEEFDDNEEAIYQNSIFMQKILRGRAAQVTIFEGRERCRELIEELRSNFALMKGNETKLVDEKDKTKQEQFASTRCMQNIATLEANLKKLGGYVVGTLLDFLNKELGRLLRERKVHAIALLVQRERDKREAAEAGRRQKEIQRRKEHDEIFKQILKVQQDTVDVYLEDIIKEGLDFNSEEEATAYIQNMAKLMDEQNDKIKEASNDELFKEEYIADLVHHFVVPEVEKQIVRQRMKERQRKYLITAHEQIYNTMEILPSPYIASTQHSVNKERVKYGIDSAALKKEQSEERKTVLGDIQSILDELIMAPMKIKALENLKPCHKTPPLEEDEEEEEEEGTEEASELSKTDDLSLISQQNSHV